jgi:folate-dependent phosphoribosylglycinamide formyltransferase PurN
MDLAVFAYDFPHRKTHDFLCEMALAGVRCCVLAAPWRQLSHPSAPDPEEFKIAAAAPLPTSEICRSLGFEYRAVEHDDLDAITPLIRQGGFKVGIISGARILKRPVLELFDGGIVNFHPGPIPETSGPDSFFHMIRRRVLPGVTTHFIDARVDAGRKLAFTPTEVGPDDPPELVRWNIYQTQIRALRELLAGPIPKAEAVSSYRKNGFLSTAEKAEILKEFGEWREMAVSRQRGVSPSASPEAS